MAKLYKTREGGVLYDICFRYYGCESAEIGVLEANPSLSEYSALFPSGIAIALPDTSKHSVRWFMGLEFKPYFSLLVDSQDITREFQKHLISLTLTDNAGNESDRLGQ